MAHSLGFPNKAARPGTRPAPAHRRDEPRLSGPARDRKALTSLPFHVQGTGPFNQHKNSQQTHVCPELPLPSFTTRGEGPYRDTWAGQNFSDRAAERGPGGPAPRSPDQLRAGRLLRALALPFSPQCRFRIQVERTALLEDEGRPWQNKL